ncbi:hypothetical protein RBB78_11310 [Tunturiibacter empetritectus]|uniref:hypothetical protein n=1 Tax=Tunturiibacter empetritectus TaxID=3069691 RepID=UPI003D9BD6EB
MPNVTSFSGIYDLPAGHNHRFASTGAGNALLGGWSLNTILSLQSGMPVTVTQATNNNSFAGFSLQRPNIIGNPKLPSSQRTPARFFNTATPTNPGAFGTALQFEIGTASRNPVRGPAYRDLDISLIKRTDWLKKLTLSSAPRCSTSRTRRSFRSPMAALVPLRSAPSQRLQRTPA